MRKIKIIPQNGIYFIKHMTVYTVILLMMTSLLQSQEVDDLALKIVERIGKKKEWNASSEPKFLQNNELSGIKGEVTDHLKRFDVRKVQEFAFSYTRDSSQYWNIVMGFGRFA